MSLRLFCLVGALCCLGSGTLELHSFNPPFLRVAQEALLNHQAGGLGIPEACLVLSFLEPLPDKGGGESPGFFFRCSPQWVHVLSTMCVNANRFVWVIEPPRDDLEGVLQLPCPRESPLAPNQVKGALLLIEESVHATATPLKGKDASSKQHVEGPEVKAQPFIATAATEEDTRPKVLIHREWRKVPDGYPKDASCYLERDQQFIHELAKQLVVELHEACQLNTSPSAKPKSLDTKIDLIYKRACLTYLLRVHMLYAFHFTIFSSAYLVYQWWRV